MKIKIHNLTAFFVVAASAVLLGAVGIARAADQCFNGRADAQVRRFQRGD